MFMMMAVVFCVCLITANLLETKLITLGPFAVTAGLLVFPISYIINDCIAEVWGFRRARLIIWLGFIMNFFVVAIGNLAVYLPSPSFWNGAEHFNFVFGMAPRIAIGSFGAFLLGSFLNAYVMSKMKISSSGKHFSYRAILSTIVGETADSLLFFPVAFGGIIPVDELLKLVAMQAILKTSYEVIVLPITIRIVRYVKKHEGEDVYDENISYNILKISDI